MRSRIAAGALAVAAFGAVVPPGAQAAQPNAGGGAFSGDISFSGNGIPPVNTPCRAASFTLSALAAVALANGAGSQSVWANVPPVGSRLTGSGTSTCENTLVGGGVLALDPINVVNPVTQARLACTSMTGSYTRTGTDLAAVLSGRCAIDSFDAGPVTVYVRAGVEPAPGTGNGATTNVTAATISGTFVIVPA